MLQSRSLQRGSMAKESAKPMNLMMQNKKIEEQREILLGEQKDYFNQHLNINFIEDSTRKAKYRQVERDVEAAMKKRSLMLNEKRLKLRDLLEEEQQRYEKELEANFVISSSDRAEQLRRKADTIRSRRDEEVRNFVQEKLDQKWRSECDDLRTYESKYWQSKIGGEHLKQMEEKKIREAQRLEEEAYFATMWQKDIDAKKAKEDFEAAQQALENRQVAQVLKEQMRVLEKQREDQRRALYLNTSELENIEKMEKQLNFEKKRRDQAIRRQELDQFVKLKLMKEAQLVREEQAYDLKAIEEALASFQSEDAERKLRKDDLMREQQLYRQHLQKQYEEEKMREKELEMIINNEVEKQLQKRITQWRAEKQARSDLLQKVIKERQVQINEKIERNKEKELQLEREKLELNQMIEFYKEQEKQEKNNFDSKNRQYGDDLAKQIEYKTVNKQIINNRGLAEFQGYVKAEKAYVNKLDETKARVEQLRLKK